MTLAHQRRLQHLHPLAVGTMCLAVAHRRPRPLRKNPPNLPSQYPINPYPIRSLRHRLVSLRPRLPRLLPMTSVLRLPPHRLLPRHRPMTLALHLPLYHPQRRLLPRLPLVAETQKLLLQRLAAPCWVG
jgi:hypothetical protein